NTGECRALKYPVQRDDQESRFTRDLLPGYAFLPDGKEIVVSYGGKIHRLSIEKGEDRVIPFTAQVSQELGPRLNFPRRVEQDPVRARLIQDAAQSPDSKRLVFSALTHLYTMDIPGGKPRRLTSGNAREFQPAWSPDGQWLAYVTWSSDGGQIWKVRADGQGQPQQLTRLAAFYSEPAWTPDGARIVALRGSAHDRMVRQFDFGQTPGADLVWIAAEGGEANLILPARGVGRPHFTHEKDRISVNVNSPSVPLKKLTDVGADYFDWADDGKTITWAIGPSFFRQAFDTVTFEPPKKEDEEKKADEEKKDAEADQVSASSPTPDEAK